MATNATGRRSSSFAPITLMDMKKDMKMWGSVRESLLLLGTQPSFYYEYAVLLYCSMQTWAVRNAHTLSGQEWPFLENQDTNDDRQHDSALANLSAQTVAGSTIHQITLSPFRSVGEEDSLLSEYVQTFGSISAWKVWDSVRLSLSLKYVHQANN